MAVARHSCKGGGCTGNEGKCNITKRTTRWGNKVGVGTIHWSDERKGDR